jgi:hypothetical protein
MQVVHQQSIALTVDLSESIHIIGFNAALQGSSEFGAACESEFTVVLIATPTAHEFVSKDGFSGGVLAK